MRDWNIDAFGLVLFLLLGGLLFALMRGLRYLLRRSGMRRARRDAILRMLPVIETTVALFYVLGAIPLVFSEHEAYSPVVLGAVILGLVLVNWFAIRDLAAGLVLRAGRVAEVGDEIALEGRQGRVSRLGLRVLALETAAGQELLIPYSQLSRATIVRTPKVDGAHLRRFRVALERPDLDVLDRQRLIHHTALNHHWHSLVHEPVVELGAGNSFEVTIFTLDASRAPDVEAAVRRALAADPSR